MKLKLWPFLAFLMFSVATVIGVVSPKLVKTEVGVTQAGIVEQAPLQAPVNALVVHPTDKTLSVRPGKPEGATKYLQAQIPDSVTTPDEPLQADDVGWLDYVKANLVVLIYALIALIEVIVRLTPTDKDNSLLSALKALLDKLIPNRRVGGGTYEP